MTTKIKIGIVGATGYTGVELLRLLSSHPNAEVTAVTSRSEASIAVADYFPSLRGIYDLAFQTPEDAGLDPLRPRVLCHAQRRSHERRTVPCRKRRTRD